MNTIKVRNTNNLYGCKNRELSTKVVAVAATFVLLIKKGVQT